MNNKKAKFPFFFGSTVVLGCVLGMMGSVGGMLFSTMGVFVKPLTDAFGWGRGDIYVGLSYLTAGIIVGILTTGPLLDRFGSRRVLIVSVTISFLVVMLGPSFISSLFYFYLILFLAAVAGGPTNTVAYARVIANWFDKRRGFFIGINASGMGLGFAVVPIIVDMAIKDRSWQAGYYSLGIVMLVVVLPALIYLVIDRPEDVGLQVDDGTSVKAKSSDTIQEDTSLSLKEALKTASFWLMLPIVCIVAASLYGTSTQLIPMLTDRGVDSSLAVMVVSTMGLSVACARIVVGILLDHFFAPRLAMVVFSFSMLGIILILYSDYLPLYFLAAVFLGFGIGAEGDLMAFLVSRYYGLRHFGAIFSCVFSAYMLGTGLGPFIFGRSFDLHGDYSFILNVGIVAMLLAIFLCAFLAPYNKYKQSVSS